ncbi:MAG: hypothetical protein VCB59_09210 [Gammaproteobacteria bacterium]
MEDTTNIIGRFRRTTITVCIGFLLSGCVGTIIETAADASLAVAKTPFKVGGAIVDVVGDDED